MPTNDHEHKHHYAPGHSADDPGYEISDVNVNGVMVFLAGLVGFLVVFFGFCFVMGKVVNRGLLKQDGPVNKWSQLAGTTPKEREDLASNADLQQREAQKLTETFPTPRMETDDGYQQTSDLHAREDLLLEHYSSISGQDTVRIPIERAMELVAQRGLPVHAEAASTEAKMVGEVTPVVTAPLTTGFARTGYEQEKIEERKQQLEFSKAEGAEHASLAPVK